MKRKKQGFTLFELLVSISIIGILVALGTVAYSNAQKKARDARRRQDLKGMQTMMEQYYSAHNYLYDANCAASDDVIPGTISSFMDPKHPTYSYVKTCATWGYVVCARMEDGTGTYSGVTSCVSDPCTAMAGTTHHCLFNVQ